jgi:hypothetical protein
MCIRWHIFEKIGLLSDLGNTFTERFRFVCSFSFQIYRGYDRGKLENGDFGIADHSI